MLVIYNDHATSFFFDHYSVFALGIGESYAAAERLFCEHQLTEEEAAMVVRRDWRALIQYGASFFLLEKLGAVTGVSNLHIYAAMRGETLEDVLKTRNAPDTLYSVAAKPKTE